MIYAGAAENAFAVFHFADLHHGIHIQAHWTVFRAQFTVFAFFCVGNQAQRGPTKAVANPAPDHHALYRIEASSYELQPGQDELKVRMFWEKQGVKVTKVFTFHRGSYEVDVDHIVQSSRDWSGLQYRQLNRSESDGRTANKFIHTYTGGVVYDANIHYEKISFSDMAKKDASLTLKGGWVAMIQHYFMSAWIPGQEQENNRDTDGNDLKQDLSCPADIFFHWLLTVHWPAFLKKSKLSILFLFAKYGKG